MTTESSPFKKYWRPVLILVAIALALWLIWISLAVLIPFLIGILMAYLLIPLVQWLERVLPPRKKAARARRVVSIIVVFILFTAVMFFFIAYIGSALVAASTVMVDKAPLYLQQGLDQFSEWFKAFRGGLPQQIAERFENWLSQLGPAAGKFLQDFVVGSMAVIPASMPTVMGFLILPFFLFFLLMDYESFQKFFYDAVPSSAARRTGDILRIIGNVMGRYIRSTLVLSIIVGVMVFIGLAILQVEHAAALAALTALTQFIPIIGPVISGLILLIIVLALQPHLVIWALLVFLIAQMLLNTVFVNWIQGKYMQMHPAVIMVLLVVGGYVAGFWGMILALPVGATLWEIIKYFRVERVSEKLET
ncbi:MAG: AI-2E family transporter [Dehalococcoidia bacterium]|nr:AI-2E family transporter [Dehalococcoidia bacterium]